MCEHTAADSSKQCSELAFTCDSANFKFGAGFFCILDESHSQRSWLSMAANLGWVGNRGFFPRFTAIDCYTMGMKMVWNLAKPIFLWKTV